jgi:hypothetical protein
MTFLWSDVTDRVTIASRATGNADTAHSKESGWTIAFARLGGRPPDKLRPPRSALGPLGAVA